jgi:TP901-1 family phage major tail protein
MAKSTTVISGTDLGVYTGTGTPALLSAATSCAINISRDMRDTSNKDSASWKKVLPGQKSWTVSSENLYIPSATNGYYVMFQAMVAGTAIVLTWKTTNASDIIFSGTAYIASLSKTSPNEGNVSYSVNFQGDGAITPTDPGT